MNIALVLAGVALVLSGLVVLVRRLTKGDIGLGQLRNESPETRRAVRRAIRDGATDDARIDRLTRQVIRATPSVRWTKYLFGILVVLPLGRLVFGSPTTSDVILLLSQAALWTLAIVVTIVNERRVDRYRGLIDKPSAVGTR